MEQRPIDLWNQLKEEANAKKSEDVKLFSEITSKNLEFDRALEQYSDSIGRIREEEFKTKGEDFVRQRQRGELMNAILDFGAENPGMLQGGYSDFATEPKAKVRAEATHDLAKLDSLEQGWLIDKPEVARREKEKPRMVDVNEIQQRSKEAEVELKFDKPIKEGRLEYYIEKSLRKKELIQKLAELEQSGDYTTRQNLMQGWAALSGGFGFLETAATIGMSLVDGAGIAWGLGRAATILGRGSELARGIKAAQKSVEAVKRLNTRLNAGAEFTEASLKIKKAVPDRMLAAAQKEGFIGKLGYDAYRFGMMENGTAASLASTIVPFAIEGAIAEIPFAYARQQMEANEGGEMSLKEGLIDILETSAFAGVMPFAGKTLSKTGKGVASGFGKVQELMITAVNKKVNEQVVEASFKGYKGVVEEAEREGKTLQSSLQKTSEIAASNNHITDDVAESIDAIKGLNLNGEEESTVIGVIIDCAKKGDFTNFNNLPIKSMWMSSTKGLTDFIKNNALEIDVFPALVKLLSESGVKLVHTPGKIKPWFGSTKLMGEKGALGRHGIIATTDADAQEMTLNMVKFLMSDDAEVKATAKAMLDEHMQQMDKVRQNIFDISLTYKKLASQNKSTYQSQGAGIHSMADQRYAYKLSGYRNADKLMGSLTDALEELAIDMLLSKEERSVLLDYLKGWRPNSSQERTLVTQLENRIDNFITENTYVNEGTKKKFINLLDNPVRDGRTEWGEIASDMWNSIRDTEYMMGLEEAFEEEVGNLKKLSEDIKNDIPIDVANHEIVQPIEGASQEIKVLNKEVQASADRLSEAKASFTDVQNLKGFDVVSKGMKALTSRFDKEQTVAKGYIFDMSDKIEVCEKILETFKKEAGKVRNTIIENLHANPEIQAAFGEDITGADIKKALFKESNTVRKVIVDSFEEATGVRLPMSLAPFKDELSETVNGLINHMIDDFEGAFEVKVSNVIDFEAPLPAAEKASEEVAEAGTKKVVQEIDAIATDEASKKALDDLLKPLMTDIGRAVMDYQTQQFMAYTNFVKLIDDCVANPGQMAERFLEEISSGILPTFGSSTSIENLANVTRHWQDFRKMLAGHTSENSGNAGLTTSLLNWAFEDENFDEIRKAIAVEIQCLSIDDVNIRAGMKSGISQNALKVAHYYMESCADVQRMLHSVGSGKSTPASMMKGAKISNAQYYYGANALNGRHYQGINNILNSDMKEITDGMKSQLSRWLVTSNSKEDISFANIAMHFLEALDMRKHFSGGTRYKADLNAVRDALVNGGDFRALIKKHGAKEVEKSLKVITNGMLGSTGEEVGDIGLIRRLSNGSTQLSEQLDNPSSKFLNDTKERLHYMNNDYALDDLKYFGYDNLEDWFKTDIGNSKKAYAILAKASADPYHFFECAKELLRAYVYDDLSKEMLNGSKESIANYEKLKKRIGSGTFDAQVRYLVNNVCGTYNIPACAFYRGWKVFQRITTSPMLMAAGVKSFADYSNQVQGLITMGFAQSSDIGARWRVYKRAVSTFSDKLMGKDLRSALLLQGSAKTGFLEDTLFNTGAAMANDLSIGVGGLNQYAPTLMKWEAASKEWANFITDKCARVGTLTEYNRSNAAISIMNAIGELSGSIFEEGSTSAKRAQATLGRYGITKYEWENIYSKHCIQKISDWGKGHGAGKLGELGEQKMFFADSIKNLTDEQIEEMMKAQGKRVSKESIYKYRNELLDKGAMVVNTGADELTSIPSARIQGMLSAWADPNSGVGVAANALTQFQSYGAAVTMYHHGRRLAAFVDPSDPMWNNIMLNGLTHWNSALSLSGAIAETTIATGVINSALGWATGQGKTYKDETGRWDVGAMATDSLKTIADQAGMWSAMVNAFLDTTFFGRSNGGGLSVPVAPAISNAIGMIGRPVKALTRSSTKGAKGEAFAGAIGEDIARGTFANYIPFKAFYSCTLGDILDKWQQGTNYYRQKHKKDTMYGPNWVEELYKLFTNN